MRCTLVLDGALLALAVFLFLTRAFGADEVRVIPAPTKALLLGIAFADDRHGVIVGGNREKDPAVLLRTEDGGESWMVVEVPGDGRLYDVHFPTSTVGYAVGLGGRILKTTSAGRVWRSLAAPANSGWLATVHFTSSEVGHVAGGDAEGSRRIYRTGDGGKTWLVQDVSIGEEKPLPLRDLTFLTSETGFAVGWGVIFKTVNGGERWKRIEVPTDAWLRGIDFVDDRTGFVVGRDGVILRTTDAGEHWKLIASGTRKLDAVRFVSPSEGYITTFRGLLLQTTDGGDNWKVIHSVGGHHLNGISVTADRGIIIVGDQGVILRKKGSSPSRKTSGKIPG